MRIALLADIHGNIRALEAVLADVRAQAPDLVLVLGDHLSGPLEAREVAERLMGLGVPALRGNHDRYLVEQAPAAMAASDAAAHAQLGAAHLGWLRGLPATLSPVDGLLACHATPFDDETYLAETVLADGTVRAATGAEVAARLGGAEATVVVCGHTHLARLVRAADGRLVVNPGSVGQPGYLDTLPVPHAVAAGSPHARYALLDRVGGGFEVTFRALGYDWDAAAELARRAGRGEWARALAVGDPVGA